MIFFPAIDNHYKTTATLRFKMLVIAVVLTCVIINIEIMCETLEKRPHIIFILADDMVCSPNIAISCEKMRLFTFIDYSRVGMTLVFMVTLLLLYSWSGNCEFTKLNLP